MTSEPQDQPNISQLTSQRFREVLGQYPTGVAVITACQDDGSPVGMVVGSFGAVSLDPPLVAFMPDKKSATWQRLKDRERFCVNVLAANHLSVCRELASKRPDKFSNIEWQPSPQGSPIIADTIAWIECDRDKIYDAGDHLIVLGRVTNLSHGASETPLLFFRGGYGTFTSRSMVGGDTELLRRLAQLDLMRDTLENLAAELSTEVTAVALIKGELNLIGAYGTPRSTDIPTRVGQRIPFMPPIGGALVAWATPDRQKEWISQCSCEVENGYQRCHEMIENIRRRGYAIGLGHKQSRRWVKAAYRVSSGDSSTSVEDMRRLIRNVFEDYNPGELQKHGNYELHFAQAPIFDADGFVEMGITVWGPDGKIPHHLVQKHTSRLIAAAEEATRRIGGIQPDISDPSQPGLRRVSQ